MSKRTVYGVRKTKLSTRRQALSLLPLFIIVALIIAGCGSKAQLPETSSDTGQEAVSIDGLSADQSRIVQQSGYPDQFTVSFEPSASMRMETWIYSSQKKSMEFSDGRLDGQGEAEDQSGKYAATSLHPQDFNQTMTPEEAAVLLGAPVYTQDVEDSLTGGTTTVVVFNNAILLYKEGQLLSIDTQVKPPTVTPGK